MSSKIFLIAGSAIMAIAMMCSCIGIWIKGDKKLYFAAVGASLAIVALLFLFFSCKLGVLE